MATPFSELIKHFTPERRASIDARLALIREEVKQDRQERIRRVRERQERRRAAAATADRPALGAGLGDHA